jgi:hypothetical protein
MISSVLGGEVLVHASPPNRHIYSFDGSITKFDVKLGENKKKLLNLENTMWAHTVLASQTDVFGLILYTGIETRSKLNQK